MLVKNKLLKFFSVITLVCFTCTSVAWSLPEPLGEKIEVPALRSVTQDLIQIPPDLGIVKDTFQSQSSNPLSRENPFVIHIQDAHANPEAQVNIKRILEYINHSLATRGLKKNLLVAVENASGFLNPEVLNLLPNRPEMKQAVIEDLQAKGELTGSELFLLDSKASRATSVVGVENLLFVILPGSCCCFGCSSIIDFG